MKKKAGMILILLGVVAIIAAVIVKTVKEKALAASIGIIGGADGPTAIFVTGSMGDIFVILRVMGIIGVVAVIAGIILWRKKK